MLLHFPSASVVSPQQFPKCGEHKRNLKRNTHRTELQVHTPFPNLLHGTPPTPSHLVHGSSSHTETPGVFPDSSFSFNLPPPNSAAAKSPSKVSPESSPSHTASATILSPFRLCLHPLVFSVRPHVRWHPCSPQTLCRTQVTLQVTSWCPICSPLPRQPQPLSRMLALLAPRCSSDT